MREKEWWGSGKLRGVEVGEVRGIRGGGIKQWEEIREHVVGEFIRKEENGSRRTEKKWAEEELCEIRRREVEEIRGGKSRGINGKISGG